MIRCLIPDRLYIADQEGCKCTRPQYQEKTAARIHACKHPCHMEKFGQLAPSDRRYLGGEEAGELYLNLIDAKEPLFQRNSFEYFLRFARDHWLDQRPIFIHCNKGQSRAPTLALLFMAKCLKVIPNTSYDDAWDEFQKCYGEYKPNSGIEQWMRENWKSIQEKPVAYSGGARRKFDQYTPPDTSDISAEEAVALLLGSPLTHFATMVKIETKQHEREIPVPNILQMRVDEAYGLCMQRGIAPRLQVLKPRQTGCTTICAHLCYHHARTHHVDGMIIADEGSRTAKVWQMFCEYADHDSFPWDSTFKYDTKKASFTYADGQIGQFEQDTANDPKAGIGGTRQVILYSEAARYAKNGARTDVKVITASLASLAKVPHSLAIMESTADGANGFFYSCWQEAASLEDFRNGIHGNGWVKIFAAWFEFSEHTLQRLPHTEHHFHDNYTAREKRGIQRYGWSMEQVAWRRNAILNECGNDESIFDQDFPENDQECFLSSGRPRFDDDGVTRLEMMAASEHDLADMGVLDGDSQAVIFTPDKTNPWLWLKEKPLGGCSYIAFIDPCQGSQSHGAKNPDAHAAGVLRMAYIDEGGRFYPDELVAAIHVLPSGCRWDDSMIAQRVAMMAQYYGNCMVVPETGNGLGVLVKLRDYGAVIYQRQKQDALVPGKFIPTLGWETNSATREIWVGAMADAIREQEKAFNCCFLPAVKEMRTFVISDRGKAEAKGGAHDDWIAGIGIGLACRQFARVFMPRSIFSNLEHGQKRRQSAFSY